MILCLVFTENEYKDMILDCFWEVLVFIFGFEAGDFLSFLLAFCWFSASFSYKSFSYKKKVYCNIILTKIHKILPSFTLYARFITEFWFCRDFDP